jgi:hypothetical protein
MKTISLTAILMIMLFSSVAFATTVYTDYDGMGDLEMTTTLISSISPDITDSVTIHTGCAGATCPCCCYPNIFGGYSGTQVVSNNPFVASGHSADVTDGCVEINQYYVDYLGDQTIYTSYFTYFNGTGTAESYVYVVPGEAMSYQLANGTGTSYVSFTQIAYIGTEFDFSTTYGGTVWVCAPGSAGLMNYYYYSGGQIYYNTQLGLYCQPVGQGNLQSFLFAQGTDHFGLSGMVSGNGWGMSQDINVEGSSDYGFSTQSNYDFDFDFEMELG